jgi:hypothetical protein
MDLKMKQYFVQSRTGAEVSWLGVFVALRDPVLTQQEKQCVQPDSLLQYAAPELAS